MMIEVTEDDLRIARYRMKRKGIPEVEREDFLHDAVVHYYQQKPEFDERSDKFSVGNWLGLVAFRRWYDYRHKLSTRKTQFMPEDFDITKSECQNRQIEKSRDIRVLIHQLPDRMRSRVTCMCLGMSLKAEAGSEGVSKQAISLRRLKYKPLLREHFQECI